MPRCTAIITHVCRQEEITSVTSATYRRRIDLGKGKGKAIPLQAWTGPKGSRRLRLPDFKTIGT